MKLEDFNVVKTLGEWSYGRVYLRAPKFNMNDMKKDDGVALKVISRLHEKSVVREIAVSECCLLFYCFTNVFILLALLIIKLIM